MKSKILVLIGILIIISTAITLTLAENSGERIDLAKGENLVKMNFEFSPLYVKDLVKINPNILVITVNESEEILGYVNEFGGIGNNFIIYPNKTYEIICKEDIVINLR
jgi:hypothetical protein